MTKHILAHIAKVAMPVLFLAAMGSGTARANIISFIGPLASATDGGTWSVILPKFTPVSGQALVGVTIYYQTTVSLSSVTIASNNVGGTKNPALDLNAVNGFLNTATNADILTAEQLRIGKTTGGQQTFTTPGKATSGSPALSTTFTSNLSPTLNNLSSFANGTGAALASSFGDLGLQGVTLHGTSVGNYVATPGDTSFTLSGNAQVDFKGTTSPIGAGGNNGLTITGWTGLQNVQVEVDYTYTPEPAHDGPDRLVPDRAGHAAQAFRPPKVRLQAASYRQPVIEAARRREGGRAAFSFTVTPRACVRHRVLAGRESWNPSAILSDRQRNSQFPSTTPPSDWPE